MAAGLLSRHAAFMDARMAWTASEDSCMRTSCIGNAHVTARGALAAA
jgi:hypothetical protein